MLESYLTPLITSYLSKYIKNIKPSDLQLSFWGGDAVLRNLELCPEAIEDALKGLVPFNLKSGCVKSLTIHIPWTAIGSEPILLSMDNIECTVNLKSLRLSEMPTEDPPSGPNPSAPQINDQSPSAPGYVQGLLNRIINNIVINMKNIVVNIIQEESDLLMSVSVKSLRWCTANDSWIPEYMYIDSFQSRDYSINKMCSVDGMTVCVDQIGSAGQVEAFEDPFIPRCSFECRIRNRFEDNLLTENIVDLMVEELLFSVTEAQFSLFLHLMDWLLAMYYSFKRLKGRDDVTGCASDIPTNDSREDSTVQEVREKSLSQSPSGTDDAEQGWGSWLMSFVDPADVPALQPSAAAATRTHPPKLSMNLIAKTIIIDMKVNQKKRNPVFFATPTKVSSQVVRICFQGCSSHISRVPSSTLLGVSVGVMSVNASISGLCPCKVKYRKTSRPHHGLGSRDGSNDKHHQIHMYTLGGSSDSATIDRVLEGTFFQSVSSQWVNPTPEQWLQRKDYYKGMWFSYEYYDKGPDRVEEVCHECVVLGGQSVMVSPDVIHRVEVFIDKFVTSLEAVPLFSKGLVVIGDPTAKTHLKLKSDPVKIVFTSNQHLLPLEPPQHSDRSRAGHSMDKGTTSPSILSSCKSVEISVTMAMYSGNDTPMANQEFRLNAKCHELQVKAHKGPVCKDVSGLSEITLSTDSDASIPSLILTHDKVSRGQDLHTDTRYQIHVPMSSICVDRSQLLTFCAMYLSWTHPPSHHLSCDQPSSSNTVQDDLLRVLIQLKNIDFEMNCLSMETSYALSLQSVNVSLVKHSDQSSLPVLLYPMNTKGFVDLVDVVSTCGHTIANEEAMQLHVVQKSLKGPAADGLAVHLKSLGCFIILERDTLSFINITLTDLIEVSTQQTQPVVLQEGHTAPPTRPEPDGLSSVDHYSPTTYGSPAGVMGSQFTSLPLGHRIIEDGQEELTNNSPREEVDDLQNRLLAILNEVHLNVNIDHMVIVSVNMSLSKYWTTLQDQASSPFLCIPDILISERAVCVVLPIINVYTTETDFYRSFATMLPGASSWQAALTNGTIYATGGGSHSDYILHPLNITLSVAPITAASSIPMGEAVSGYGVHVDVNLLHISLSIQKVSLVKDLLVCVVSSIVQPLSAASSHNQLESVPLTRPHVHSPSVLSSPHLTQSLQYNPTSITASDSSYSLSSTARAQQPSLWLQCTLTKLTVDLVPINEGTSLTSDRWFLYESDDLSFSLDKQDKYLNFQFKMSTLEGHYKKPPTNDISKNIFSKLFSSKSTIFNEDVLMKVESINRDWGSPCSPTMDDQPPLHGAGLTSHTSFIVFDLRRYLLDPHKPLMVKLHIKMFEAVVTIPLVKIILELTKVVTDSVTHSSTEPTTTTYSSCSWPQFDIGLECFRVLFPCVPPSTSGVILDTGGVSVRSDLSYPITRMEVNSTAFRRLSIMVSEKRLPPLPGYEVHLSNIMLIGLSADWKDNGTHRAISVFPILSMANTQIQYSPSLQWIPLYTSQTEKAYATGNMIEVCVKSDVQLSLGISQIATLFKLSRDFLIMQNSLNKSHTIDNKEEQTDSHSSVAPFQILVTTNNLQISYYQGSTVAVQLTVTDPVAMVKKSDSDLLSLKCSIFRMESIYRNEVNEYVSLLKCIGPQHSDNLLTVNIDGHYGDTSQCTGTPTVVSIEMCVSVCVTLTPHILMLLNTVSTDVSMTTLSSTHSGDTSPLTTENKLWSNFKMTLKTKQLVVKVLGKRETCHHTNNSCSECIKIGCSELHMVLPHVHHTTTTASSDWLPLRRTPGTLSCSVCCIGLQVSCSNHVTTCIKHVSSFLLRPTSLKGMMIIHQMPTTGISSVTLSLVFDPVHFSVGVWVVKLVMSVLLAYNSCFESLTKRGDDINDPATTTDTSTANDKVDNKEEFKDDLRQKDMIFNTANMHERSFPNSSEIRFFEGNTVSPPHMIWKYREPHCVTRVHILPVPLGVVEVVAEGGSYPHDMTVHCRLSYYNEVNDLFVCVSDLYLSETSVALWKYGSNNDDGSCPNMGVPRVHASIWCLTIVGLKWSDEEGDIRADFPLLDTPSSTILSPLTLAGCTCVDSAIDHQYRPCLDMEVQVHKMTLSLVHQPHCEDNRRVRYYNGYIVHNDISWYPLTLMEFGVDNFKGSWSLGSGRHQTIKMDSILSLVVQDFKDLSMREVVHPTHISVAVMQELSSHDVSVRASMEPCLIRISPTLVHTVTMATRTIINQMSHDHDDDLSCDQKVFSHSVLFATYIVCNMTTENLYMGQESTIEWLSLPRGSSIGYSWSTNTADEQRLRLALAEEERDQWTWSSPFVLDEDRGLQEVAIGQEQLVYLYIEIRKHGGTQKQVIISGLWSIYSTVSHPLLVCPSSDNNQVEHANYELLENLKNLSFIVRRQECLGIMSCGHDNSTVSGIQYCVTVTPSATMERDKQLPVKIHDDSLGDLYFWCNISKRHTSKCFKQCPLEIVMVPCFKVISSLPFNVTLVISSNDVTHATAHTLSVHGCGHQTIPCSLIHNVWYLIKMSYLPVGKDVSDERGVTSDAFPLSTCIGNQLTATDDTDCGVWPYSACTNHKPTKVKSKDPSTKTLLLPVDENSDSTVTVHVELQRDHESGTIVITLSPDVLIVNETGMDFCLLTGVDLNNEIIMDKGGLNVTAIVKRNEEFRIKLSLDSVSSAIMSSSLSLNTINLPKDNKKLIKRVKLYNEQFGSEVIMELSFHKSSLIATMKPSHIIINNTDYPLTVRPVLQSSLRVTLAPYNSTMVLHVGRSDSQVLGVWSIRGSEGEQLHHMIQVTNQCEGGVSWSIPLLLNFVRHSFSLPVSKTTPSDSMATPTNDMVSCLLTTHEVDGIKYLVVGCDPFPRLVIENSSSCVLEIRETHTHWVHSHSQTIYPHSQSTYEPPSIAMQYPLIKEWVESENDDDDHTAKTVQFKQLSDLTIQIGLRSCDNHVTWSNSFSIPRDDDDETCQTINIEEQSMNVTSTGNTGGRTTVVRISSDPVSPIQDNTADTGTLVADVSLSQIVLVLDSESTPDTVRPLLIITNDHTHLTISHAPDLSQGVLTIDSVQLDAFIDSPQADGQVCLCPRYNHDPPASLLKPSLQSFICIEVELATNQNIFSKVNVSVQPLTVNANDIMTLRIINGIGRCIPPPSAAGGECLPGDGSLVKLKPVEVLAESARDRLPLSIHRLTISPIKVYLTAHTSTIMCLSCDDAFLGFSDIVLINTHTNTTELFQFLSLHYITGLVMQLGWVLGSLDIVGSPSSLLYRLRNGLYNFLYLPYEGLTRGPGFFVMGVGRGVSSLVANSSGGVLKAITNFSTSVANNMERLSLDPDHISYQASLRQRSQGGLSASLLSGVSGFGMSLVSAVAGIVDQPMQVMHQAEAATAGNTHNFTQQMTTGVGKGLLGLVTKPIGGAFQLVSQTGQGILNSSGLLHKPSVKHDTLHQLCLTILKRKNFQGSTDKYMRLLKGKHYSSTTKSEGVALSSSDVVFQGYASINLPSGSSYECLVLMDCEKLYVFDIRTDCILACLPLVDYQCHTEESAESQVLEEDKSAGDNKSISNDNPITNDHRAHEDTTSSVLPYLGGNRVVLSLVHVSKHRQRLSSSVSSCESYSVIERYLNEVADDVKSEVSPQKGQQYAITFTLNHAHLFESVFNHNIHTT